MHQLQRSWVRSQHPSAQWNLRGGRWSSIVRTKALKLMCWFVQFVADLTKIACVTLISFSNGETESATAWKRCLWFAAPVQELNLNLKWRTWFKNLFAIGGFNTHHGLSIHLKFLKAIQTCCDGLLIRKHGERERVIKGGFTLKILDLNCCVRVSLSLTGRATWPRSGSSWKVPASSIFISNSSVCIIIKTRLNSEIYLLRLWIIFKWHVHNCAVCFSFSSLFSSY